MNPRNNPQRNSFTTAAKEISRSAGKNGLKIAAGPTSMRSASAICRCRSCAAERCLAERYCYDLMTFNVTDANAARPFLAGSRKNRSIRQARRSRLNHSRSNGWCHASARFPGKCLQFESSERSDVPTLSCRVHGLEENVVADSPFGRQLTPGTLVRRSRNCNPDPRGQQAFHRSPGGSLSNAFRNCPLCVTKNCPHHRDYDLG